MVSTHYGVRQGCSFSGILFKICVEILAHLIRQNDDIKGVNIDREEIKLLQFADDTNIFVTMDRSIRGTQRALFSI